MSAATATAQPDVIKPNKTEACKKGIGQDNRYWKDAFSDVSLIKLRLNHLSCKVQSLSEQA